MNKNFFKNISFSILIAVININLFGGNPDRSGQAGAAQLNINAFARSSGWGLANVCAIKGVESMFMNVAGLAKSGSTEVVLSRTNWLGKETGVAFNSFGLAQKLGEKGGTFGISVMASSISNIQITTVEQPDGGLGTYKPQLSNIGVAYAKEFTPSISGGILFRLISESIPSVKANGLAIDAGVQYATSTNMKNRVKGDDLHFGISVKNVGPDMRFSGDGLSISTNIPGASYSSNLNQRADRFNLPSFINISGGYDLQLDKDKNAYNHKLSLCGTFSNYSFSANKTSLGVQYSYKNILMLRGAYMYEKGITNKETAQNAFNGINAGVSIEIPFSKANLDNTIAFDYSIRTAYNFGLTHSFGINVGFN